MSRSQIYDGIGWVDMTGSGLGYQASGSGIASLASNATTAGSYSGMTADYSHKFSQAFEITEVSWPANIADTYELTIDGVSKGTEVSSGSDTLTWSGFGTDIRSTHKISITGTADRAMDYYTVTGPLLVDDLYYGDWEEAPDNTVALDIKYTVYVLVQSSPSTWMAHLTDRRAGGETIHTDDQEFTGAIGGTAVTPTGTVTWAQGRSLLSASYEDQATADIAARLYPLTPSTFPVTVEVALRYDGVEQNNMAGVVLADGTAVSSNYVSAHTYFTTTTRIVTMYQGVFSNVGSEVTGPSQMSDAQNFGLAYLRLIWTASNTFKLTFSVDGVTWIPLTGTMTDTLTPTYFGALVSSYGGTGLGVASFEYLRITESDLS